MKKLLILSALSVCASAGFAQAFDMPNNLEERSIDLAGGNINPADTPTVVYSGIPGPYSAFAAATGALGNDDYHAANTGAIFQIDSMRFVGGVTAVGGSMNFSFFDSSAAFVGGFNTTFGTAGNFIWTITGLSGLGLQLPKDGFLQISANSGTTGQWFFTTTAPTVGTNDINLGTGGTLNPKRYQAFELTAVPEPASMAALGLGAMALIRRRRASK